MPKSKEKSVNVGIDVGKTQLDVVIHERKLHFNSPNDAAGVRYIIGRLSRYTVERVVVEATGRREYAFVLAAAEKGLPVIISQPIKVRPQRSDRLPDSACETQTNTRSGERKTQDLLPERE